MSTSESVYNNGSTEAAELITAHEAAADPHAGYQRESEKGAANGYAGLGAGGLVPAAQLGTGTPTSAKWLGGDSAWTAPTAAQVGADPTGTASAAVVAHVAAGNPHTVYQLRPTYTPPPASAGWLQIGATGAVLSDESDGRLKLVTGSAVGDFVAPTGLSSTFRVEAAFRVVGLTASGTLETGLCVKQGARNADDRRVRWMVYRTSGGDRILQCQEFFSATSTSAVRYSVPLQAHGDFGTEVWLAAYQDSTTLYLAVSVDGDYWVTPYSQGKTSHLSSGAAYATLWCPAPTSQIEHVPHWEQT